MPAAHLKGMICTGHHCYPPRPNVQGSPDVYINGIPEHRQGDLWAKHCCDSCHSSVLAKGAPNVYVNGKQAARIGDPVACGSRAMQGSNNVFIGDA
jgi:uncharacterized Zn-binding protein involved in type VI secretion